MRMVRSAVLHPLILLVMMTVVMIVLIILVIPMFNSIFMQFDSSVSEMVSSTVTFAYNTGIVIMIVLLVLIAAVLAVVCFFFGIVGSFAFELPAGASVVAVNAAAFLLFLLAGAVGKKVRGRGA